MWAIYCKRVINLSRVISPWVYVLQWSCISCIYCNKDISLSIVISFCMYILSRVISPCVYSLQSYHSCHKLEETLPCFEGLINSLTERPKEWNEYFASNMSVVNKLPGDSLNLSLLQKCILWKIVLPQRVSGCYYIQLVLSGNMVLSTQSIDSAAIPSLLLPPSQLLYLCLELLVNCYRITKVY